MSGDRIDPELLAAFLDGTASPEERDGVMRALARSKDAYAEFVEAAAVKGVLDDAGVAHPADLGAAHPAGDAPVTLDTSAKKKSSRWLIGPLLLAAGVTGVILVGRLATGGGAGSIQLAQEARLTRASGSGSVARTLGASWDQPPWSVTRGSGTSLAPQPRAFRAGALYAELEVAAGASDSAAVLRIAESLADLVASVEAGAPLAARVRTVVAAPDFGGRAQRAATAGQLRALLGADAWFDLGVWTETARLAIAARDSAFFEPGSAGMTEATRILRSDVPPADSAAWAAAVDPLRPLLTDGSRPASDLESLDRAVRNTIVVAAR